jgi:YidC/Oxa1 family membrane protein insertase
MISGLYNLLIYEPLYNGLVFLMDIIPWADAGIVVVIFTVVIKLILFPISRKAVLTQKKIKQFEPEIAQIKEKYKKDRQEQAQKIFAFYKEKGINPFSSFFLILLQLPIVIALYRIFWRSGLPEIQKELLYSFIAVPSAVNMVFLGLIDISMKSWPLALLVGISTFIQMRLSMPAIKPTESPGKSFRDDLARGMNIQMRYFFPFIAVFISYNISGAIALYWLTSNLFTTFQELLVRKETNKPSQQNIKT